MKKIAFMVGCLFLVGCNEEQDALYKQPVVQNVGQYDGCDVKFVNRGYQSVSFFIAKCGGTVTTTTNYHVQSGKTSTFYRNTTIIDGEIDNLKAERERAAVVEAAKKKLTTEELKLLGIGVEK